MADVHTIEHFDFKELPRIYEVAVMLMLASRSDYSPFKIGCRFGAAVALPLHHAGTL